MPATLDNPALIETPADRATESFQLWLTDDASRFDEACEVLDWAAECEWSPERTATELLEWAASAMAEDVPSRKVGRVLRRAEVADGATLAEWVESCR
jgi:hypothetical protein